MKRIAEWITALPFVVDIVRDIKTQAFRDAQKDILETMADDLDKKANELADGKISKIMSVVDWKNVVTFDERKGIIFIGGSRADSALLGALKAEAQLLMASSLWNILYQTPNALAQQIMFKTGEDVDSFKKGRAMLFHLDTQKKILETLCAYTQQKNVAS